MTMAEVHEYERQWHLDKKVPIALILALAVQTVAIVWWAAALSVRVDSLERAALAVAPQAERIVRVETKMDMLTATLTEIKAMLRNPRELRP
jgi:hypothetical protein